MSHAVKHVTQRFSFVTAVTSLGDFWRNGAPLYLGTSDSCTQDRRESYFMDSMERGHRSRVELSDDDKAFEKIEVGEYAFGFCATREGYDGAPDSNCAVGVGLTKFEAIAALLDDEELRRS